LHRSLCICAFIPQIESQTKLSLIIHTKELKRTTNTGTLAAKALVNSVVFIRGKIDQPFSAKAVLDPGYQSILFYPCDDAIALTPEFIKRATRPINLIVPDGNWRQASKIHSRHPEFKDLPRVMIKAVNTATQHLRAESSPEGMATLQAIAHAYGVIESLSHRNSLLELYQRKLDATLHGRAGLGALLQPR
jgi:DTW domain-containing protein YfiP